MVPRGLPGEGVYPVVNGGHDRARFFEAPEGEEVFFSFLRESRKRILLRDGRRTPASPGAPKTHAAGKSKPEAR